MARPALTPNPLPPASRDVGKVKGDGLVRDPSGLDALFRKVVGVEPTTKSLGTISQGKCCVSDPVCIRNCIARSVCLSVCVCVSVLRACVCVCDWLCLVSGGTVSDRSLCARL